MTSDQLTHALQGLENKLEEVRLDVRELSTKTEALRDDVKTLSIIPSKIASLDTRTKHNEDEIRSIRSRSWAVLLLLISSILAAAGSITVQFMTG